LKLTQFTNPLSGEKGSVFDLGKMWSLVLGVGVILIVLNLGQRIAGTVAGKLPGGISPGFSQPLVAQPVAVENAKRIYQ